MIPRKKRRAIIIVSIVLTILVIAGIFVGLYLTTDMFKSNNVLFLKYISNGMEGLTTILDDEKGNEYNSLLEKNKYTEAIEAKINFVKNIETSEESSDSTINKLKLKIDRQVDKSNNYNYGDIQILNEDEKIYKVETIKNNDVVGIRFSDIIKQFVSAQNENIKELISVADTNEILEKIPDEIKEVNFNNIFNFSEEEKKIIQDTYSKVLVQNISKDNFSKQAKALITVNERDITTNAYIAKISIEQLNNIYIKILEEIKEDEILSSKIEILQDVLQNYGIELENDITLRDKVNNYIDKKVEEIKDNNIGNEIIKMTVYENKGQTVRFSIETEKYKRVIDIIKEQNDMYVQYSELIYSETENSKTISLKKSEDNIDIEIQNIKNSKIESINLNTERNIQNNKLNKVTSLSYTDNINKSEFVIKNNTEIVNSFKDEMILDEENNVVLNDLKEEQINNVLNIVSSNAIEKSNQIFNILKNDLEEILKSIGILQEKESIEELTNMTQTEKNRFNNKFELYNGEEVSAQNVIELMNVAKDSLELVEIEEETKTTPLKITLTIKKDNIDEENAQKIISLLEDNKNKNKKYKVEIEHNEEGIVNIIRITKKDK